MHLVSVLEQQVTKVRADEPRAAGEQETHVAVPAQADGVGRRLCLSTVPPNPPSITMASPPPIRASSESLPAEESWARLARRTAAGSGVGVGARVASLGAGVAWLARPDEELPDTEPRARDDAEPLLPDVGLPELGGGVMPLPNGAGEEPCLDEEAGEPVCLAWLSVSTYCFSAGEPGSR